MSICPKCGLKLKYKIIENTFKIKSNKLKCNNCNTRLEVTKKTDMINSTLVSSPIILGVFYGHDIINFITIFTKSNSISKWLLIFIMAAWGTIIYNGIFSWSQFQVVEEN
ncbi:hypothetical protein [uncultured Clostridium sp.]|uniref:hypothetical protein n=1 Tax=uncultured Clostridium sp. TaxID=59620 RepID=UPI0025D222D3|nr:hypothetical protein [uncultured Clostridium sp.]MDU4883405.1 hypothetical protein [Clostridium celatum]MDU7076468.1 hypothetical protein [Clostridium celatum]